MAQFESHTVRIVNRYSVEYEYVLYDLYDIFYRWHYQFKFAQILISIMVFVYRMIFKKVHRTILPKSASVGVFYLMTYLKIGYINQYPLFRVRPWSNCMSYIYCYIVFSLVTEILSVAPSQCTHRYVYFGSYLRIVDTLHLRSYRR